MNSDGLLKREAESPWRESAALILCSCLALCLAAGFLPQGVYGDPAWQLFGLKQFLAGKVPTLNHSLLPDFNDLARDRVQWNYVWPPGTALGVYPFMAWFGLSMAGAIRALIVLCLVAGSLGWARWICVWGLPVWWRRALLVLWPWMHYTADQFSRFSSEVFVFALTPWLLLGALALTRLWQQPLSWGKSAAVSFLCGAALGSVYWSKYTAVFASLGVLAFLGLRAGQEFFSGSSRRTRGLMGFVWMAIGFCVPVAALVWLNVSLAKSANLIVESFRISWEPIDFAYLFGLPPLALADADGLLRYLLMHPQHGMFKTRECLAFLGLAGTGIFVPVLRGSGRRDAAALLAWCVLLVSMAAMACVWLFSSLPFYDARYFAAAGLGMAPFVLHASLRYLSGARGARRFAVIAALVAYLGLPYLYGAVSVFAKIARAPRHYRAGPTRLYLPTLSSGELPSVVRALEGMIDAGRDVVLVSDPSAALELPGRILISYADFIELEILRSLRFNSSQPLRVHLLLPPHFEGNGKGSALRGAFVQAQEWKSALLEGSGFIVWSATLTMQERVVAAQHQ